MAQRNFLLMVFVAIIAVASGTLLMLVRDSRDAPPIVIEDAPSDVDIVVWVGGEVATPGIYLLPSGSRVNDALTAAGGMSNSADASSINLAARIADEDRIEVPSVAAAQSIPTTGNTPSFGIRSDTPVPVESDVDDRINVNTASAAELESLPGIGPALAERIIEFRTVNGQFENIEELAQINGISVAMVEEMSGLISVGS